MQVLYGARSSSFEFPRKKYFPENTGFDEVTIAVLAVGMNAANGMRNDTSEDFRNSGGAEKTRGQEKPEDEASGLSSIKRPFL